MHVERQQLIQALERERKSRVIAYFLSDRRGAQAQIAEDAVRQMYDHLRSLGRQKRLDLFLYSVGGHTDVPWRIVSMMRNCADHFAVLVPYKAMSAATMIALGADEIVMGPKGELGPIDPTLSIHRGSEATPVQEQISVEDVMAFVRFIREKAGLTDQAALAGLISALAAKVDPCILGQINRMHSHIRIVARKLLTSRGKSAPVLDEQRIQVIVETLAERTFQHGHAVGRHEAKELGLNVTEPTGEVDRLMWALLEEYEGLCRTKDPIDMRTFVPTTQEENAERMVLGCIESRLRADHFSGTMRGRRKRTVPPQIALNLSVNLQLPPNIQPQQLAASAQQALQQMLQQAQPSISALVQQELLKQMPVVGFEGWLENGAWGQIADWPSTTEGSAPAQQQPTTPGSTQSTSREPARDSGMSVPQSSGT